MTYRYHNHSFRLPIDSYRTQEEIDQWMRRDPIELHRAQLIASGIITDESARQITADARAEMREAVAFAERSAFPEPAEAFTHLFTNPIPINGR
jgi:pyruvate dehydrogenase E1 component alpha subunit